ncbi:hypothetical protein [Pseudomonas sp. EA_5y_Pfl2_R50]|uniref:hypothetical protein n=1 Tax=Pseudomonas sp. EA_5y_Pfl2_R50 TaxID=3088691 RepID=UPI0030DA14C0
MIAAKNITTGKLKVEVGKGERFVTDKVSCVVYTGSLLLRGSGDNDREELKIQISEGGEIEQGVEYKFDGLTQSNATYTDHHGVAWYVKGGRIKLTTFDLKNQTAIFDFDFKAFNEEGVEKDLNGDGAFQGFNTSS